LKTHKLAVLISRKYQDRRRASNLCFSLIKESLPPIYNRKRAGSAARKLSRDIFNIDWIAWFSDNIKFRVDKNIFL